MHFLQDSAADVNGAVLSNSVMTIANDGKVGIGETGPDEKLDVAGAIHLVGDRADGTAVGLYLSHASGIGEIISNGVDGTTVGNLLFGVRESDGQNQVNAMFISSSGWVGLGTAIPGAKLHVSASTHNTTIAKFERNYDGDAGQYIVDIRSGAKETQNAALYVHSLGSAPAAAFMGNDVGIGTIAPTSSLHIAGQPPELTLHQTSDSISDGTMIGSFSFSSRWCGNRRNAILD
jgi:hypothetical protein